MVWRTSSQFSWNKRRLSANDRGHSIVHKEVCQNDVAVQSRNESAYL